jgi:predicted esterase
LHEESGARAEIHGYRAGHEIPLAEQRDLARWYAALT